MAEQRCMWSSWEYDFHLSRQNIGSRVLSSLENALLLSPSISDQDPENTAPGANLERDLPLGGALSPFKNHPVTIAFYTRHP